jgi:hypothetical protein
VRNHNDFEWQSQWEPDASTNSPLGPRPRYILVDSPTECDGGPYRIFTRERMLDNATFHRMTTSVPRSPIFYRGSARPAVATMSRFKNVSFWNERLRGDQFSAFEHPEVFVDEVHSSLRAAR